MHSLNVHYFRVYFPLNMSNRCSNRPKTSYKHSLTSMRAYITQGLRLMIRYHRLRQDSAKKSEVRVQKLIYCNRKWTQFNTPSRWYNAKIYTSTIVAIWARLLISIMEKFGFEGAVCSAATNTKKKKNRLVPKTAR